MKNIAIAVAIFAFLQVLEVRGYPGELLQRAPPMYHPGSGVPLYQVPIDLAPHAIPYAFTARQAMTPQLYARHLSLPGHHNPHDCIRGLNPEAAATAE